MTLRAQRVELVPYDPRWSERFTELGGAIRAALGDSALRIDHHGSTAVPGLAAKPVIDVQVSVAQLEPASAYQPQLEELGYSFSPDNDDRTKRFFFRRTDSVANVHVRVAGSFGEQTALLYRDYLRAHPEAASHYGAVKSGLAERSWADVDEYANAKSNVVWSLLHEAFLWSMDTGWSPGPSDA